MVGAYLGVYGEINNGAHQKPADLVGAPAFIWHQAFWNPVSGNRGSRQERADKIDGYIRALHARIGSVGDMLSPQAKDITIAYDDRVRVITLQFCWFGIRAKIRMENHTEYFSLTSIVDASVDLSVVLSKSKDNLSADYSLYSLIVRHIENFRSGTHRLAPSDGLPTFPDINNTHKFIYCDIWDEWFFPKILDVDGYLSVVKTDDHGSESTKIGGLQFVDLRGFITCEEYPSGSDERSREDDTPSGDASTFVLKCPVQGAFYKPDEEQRGRWHRNWTPGERWARRRLDNAWPFLSLTGREGSSPLTGRTEFTVSRLLDGRVLYATALGPQPHLESTVPGLERPLLLYLHSLTQCERQIGRVVDRLCQLGTLRLATLIPLPALKSVPEKLWNIEETIKSTRDQIHTLIQEAKFWPKDDPRRSELDIKILQNLELIQNEMGALSMGKSVPKSPATGGASLEYRLQRSAYYKANFFSLFKGMRIKPLEGYQPYDGFITRRLQSAFGFIESIELRVRAIKSDWRAIDQLYLTAAITVLAREIDREQKTVATTNKALEVLQGQGNEMLRNAENTQRKIMLIQLIGEAILTMILVPYYIVGLTLHGLNCQLEEWCAKTSTAFGLNWEPMITVSWFALCAFIGGIRIFQNIRERKNQLIEDKGRNNICELRS